MFTDLCGWSWPCSLWLVGDRGESGRKVFPRDHFIRAWHRSHNTVYLIYPEGSKLPNDPMGHWEDGGQPEHP